MQALDIIRFLACIGLAVLLSRGGLPSSYTLLEYQRAVLYRRGQPIKEVGRGRYWIWTKYEKLLIVDMRPIQVGYADQNAILRDTVSVPFGILATVQVTDARKAIYSARNYAEVPAFLLISCARAILNELSSSDLKGGKVNVTDEIVRRATPRLAATGFVLTSFRLTQIPVSAAH